MQMLGEQVLIYFTSTWFQMIAIGSVEAFIRWKTLFLSAWAVVWPQWGTSNYIFYTMWLYVADLWRFSSQLLSLHMLLSGFRDNICCLGIIEKHHSMFSTLVYYPEHYKRSKLPKSITRDQNFPREPLSKFPKSIVEIKTATWPANNA